MGFKTNALAMVSVLAAAGSAAMADGPPQYRLILLGRPDTSLQDRAARINSLGDIGGSSRVFIEAAQGDGVGVHRERPVIWRRGGRQAPEVLSFTSNIHQSWTTGIDDEGRVFSHTNENTGVHSMFDGKQHDFYLEPGEADLPDWQRDVSDVSENGFVAGKALQRTAPPGAPWGNYQPATLWNPDGSRLVQLGTLGGHTGVASGVNNKGWACGSTQKEEALNAPFVPFFSIDGVMFEAALPAGALSGSASVRKLNNDGIGVGEMRLGFTTNSRAVVWNGLTNEAELLPQFGADLTPFDMADDVNDNALIIGRSSTANDFGKGVVWLDGQVFDIEALIVESDAPIIQTGGGLTLRAVNGYDEIVGYGFFSVAGVPVSESSFAFVLIPVCPADLNGDRFINFVDVIKYVDEFASERQRADINRDGLHDFTDVIAYLQRFAAGCP